MFQEKGKISENFRCKKIREIYCGFFSGTTYVRLEYIFTSKLMIND